MISSGFFRRGLGLPGTRWKLGVLTLLLLLTLTVAVGRLLQLGYRDTLQQQATHLRNLSTAFAAQTQAATRAIDQILFQARNEYASANSLTEVRFNYLKQEYPVHAYIACVYVTDNAGNIVAWSEIERPRIGKQRQPRDGSQATLGESAALSVSVSDIDDRSGRAMLNFTRPIFDEDGKRTGTVVAMINSDYVREIYNSTTEPCWYVAPGCRT